jgi:hypothetical protein
MVFKDEQCKCFDMHFWGIIADFNRLWQYDIVWRHGLGCSCSAGLEELFLHGWVEDDDNTAF